MVKFKNKGVFGLGLCPQDLRELRAGGSILLRVDGENLEVLLFIGRSDKQMMRDLKTEEVTPQVIDTNAIDNDWPNEDRRVREGQLCPLFEIKRIIENG